MRLLAAFRALLLPLATALPLGAGAVSAEPRGEPALPVEVAAARAALREHRSAEALRVLMAAGGASVTAPERTWLLVQLLPSLAGRSAAADVVEALPRSNLKDALRALLAEDARRALEAWRPRLRCVRDPWLLLALAGLAARRGEHEEAAALAVRARAAGPRLVALESLHLEMRMRLELGDVDRALARAEEAARLAPDDARAHALAGEALRRAGRVEDALARAAEAARLAPRFEPYARRLAELWRDLPASPRDAALAEALPRALGEENPEGLALRGLLERRAGRLDAALASIERALATGASPVPLERERRGLLAELGRFQDLARALEDAVPAALREAPENLLRGRWQRLAATAAAAAGGAAEARLALAEALIALGALEEARATLRRAPAAPGATERLVRLEGHLAFEGALRAEVEAGYRRAIRKLAPAGIDAQLARVRALAERHLVPDERGAFAQPGTGLRRVPPLGAWLDHRAASASPVVQHFRRYGRYLVLGQREGSPCEAIVLSLAVLEQDAPLVTRGRAHRHDFALGYDRVLRSFLDMQGGGLAGACLPDGLWLDADAALESEHDARSRLRRDPALLEAARRMPVPLAHGPDGPFSLGDGAGVTLRLLARYAAREPGGRWGSLGTLHAHENGHVIDLRRHLPFWRGLPATVSLLASVGFAPPRMEAVLERRAQLAAVIDAPDPDLALTEMLEMLPAEEVEPEAHAAGYRQALDLLVRHVWSRPDLYPEIDRARRVLPQLDRLSLEQLRRAARAVVDG